MQLFLLDPIGGNTSPGLIIGEGGFVTDPHTTLMLRGVQTSGALGRAVLCGPLCCWGI
jgi:hypothetical protein